MKNTKYILAAGVLSASFLLSSCYEKFDPESYAPPLSIGGFTSSAEIAPSNLVAYWPFDNNLADNVSKIAGENAGTTFTAGIKEAAIQGGADKYITTEVTDAVKNLKSFTVTSWVNSPQNTDGIVGILDLSNPKSFWGNLTIFFENGSNATDAILKVHVQNDTKEAWLGNYTVKNIWNTWASIAVSYDAPSSTFKFFVNGSRIATQTIAGFGDIKFVNPGKLVFGTVQFQTSPSLNGGEKQSWANYLKGQLDEVRIYNKALSETEINSLVKLEGRGK